MHEYAIVEDYVRALAACVDEEGPERVSSVRFRRGSTFSEAALRQAFQVTTAGTALEGATLAIDAVETNFTCPVCAHSQVITSDDLVGHHFLCLCGAVHEIDEAHDLELVEAIVENIE